MLPTLLYHSWHGGTPNLSREVRAIPSVEYCAPWFAQNPGACKVSMPRSIYEDLTPRGRLRCDQIVATCEEEVDTRYVEEMKTPYIFINRPPACILETPKQAASPLERMKQLFHIYGPASLCILGLAFLMKQAFWSLSDLQG